MAVNKKVIQRQAQAASMLPDSYPSLVKRVLANRGIIALEQLDDSLSALPDPWLFKDMSKAVERLWLAKTQRQKIVIVGDYDADGATSVAVLMRGLEQLGFLQVQFMVPDRFVYGYGLSAGIVDQVALLHPDIIITVDNGISSIEGVARANALGMQVIITDHHLPGDQLPAAYAIVNPNQKDCLFPSKAIAGVGVAFYLLIALRQFWRQKNVFAEQAEPNLAALLDLVALGTIADVVALDKINRIFVQQGLRRIRSGRAQVGIRQLIKVAGKQEALIASADIGFILAPRLNAAGRLDDMSQGIMLLLTDSEELAFELASLLDEFNRDRRSIEAQMQAQALQITEQILAKNTQLPKGLCLFQEDWHQGVVGLVASKIKERLYCPVIAFAEAEDGQLKGSGRSIKGVHLRDILANIASKQPQLLTRFGGHAMAAGLSLEKSQLTAFNQAFLAELAVCDEQLFEAQLYSDGALDESSLNLYVAQCLREIPWGQGLPEPLFEGQFYLHKSQVLAEKHIKYWLSLDNKMEHAVPAILFNAEQEHFVQMHQTMLRLIYRLNINYFRGEQSLQLIIEQIS